MQDHDNGTHEDTENELPCVAHRGLPDARTGDPGVHVTEARARSIVRERANGQCELCRRPANNFAHRKNRSQGGLWLPSNGLLLCGSGTTGCHGWTTGHPTYALLGGWRVLSGLDPATTPTWLATTFGADWYLLDDSGGYAVAIDYDPAEPRHLPPLATAA